VKRILTIFAVCGSSALIASAHEVRPAYLELRETTPDIYDILWKVPARGGDERLAIYVRLPPDTQQLAEPHGISAGGAYLDRWRVRRPGGLAGQTISIDGLAATGTDVLIRLEHANGSTQTARLLPSNPSFVVEAAPGQSQVAATYLRFGIEHILTGIDHLLYILAMLLLVKGWKRIVATMTAFTATHSLTLTAAALGWVHVPQPPVEACIALSILFVASEIVRARQGRAGLVGMLLFIENRLIFRPASPDHTALPELTAVLQIPPGAPLPSNGVLPVALEATIIARGRALPRRAATPRPST
jgi:hypothetical protein